MEKVNIISEKDNLNVELIENKYKYNFDIQKNFLQISLYFNNELKYVGCISLFNIKKQIYAFFDYDINEIYDEIDKLSKDKFKISKNDDNKYKLLIEFVILSKKKN